LREDDKNFKDLTTRTTETGWIEFKKEAKIDHNNFFKNYAESLGLGQHYEFRATKDETDEKQQRHQRFQLHYKNIPVEGAEFSLHSNNGILNTAI
jgi:Zn-dependent metalloprotease